MRKLILGLLLGCLTIAAYADGEVKVSKSVEESITKDFDQDGHYSSYEKALRGSQESVYVKLPEKRGYWYTMLDRIKAEEEELMPDVKARVGRKN